MTTDDSFLYLDNSATTPVASEVLEAMLPYLREAFGNAGSPHRYGRACREAIERARVQVAALLNAVPSEIVFTSGGTEADNLAVWGIAAASEKSRKEIVISAVEHHAVHVAAEVLEARGDVVVHVVGVDAEGRVVPGAVESLLNEHTVLVSIMHANNETGTVQPLEEIGGLCRDRGIPFHSDTVQSVGKISVDVDASAIDLLAMSGHKIHGPKGVGACYVRRGVRLVPQTAGGGQESARRSGTENVAGIVGLGAACALAQSDLDANAERMRVVRDRLEKEILGEIPDTWVNGSREHRLPNVLNVGFKGCEGQRIGVGLDAAGIAVSTGSTCASGDSEASPVLVALGQSHAAAISAVRFSLGRGNTEDDVVRVMSVLPGIVAGARGAERRP